MWDTNDISYSDSAKPNAFEGDKLDNKLVWEEAGLIKTNYIVAIDPYEREERIKEGIAYVFKNLSNKNEVPFPELVREMMTFSKTPIIQEEINLKQINNRLENIEQILLRIEDKLNGK